MNDYSELKRLAVGATQGQWKAVDYGSFNGKSSHWYVETKSGENVAFDDSGDAAPNHWEERGEHDMKFIAAANPAAVLELIAEVEALRKDRTDWQSECLKRGFEYVRESDDHYVLADVPEMAELLGLLLGVEVRSKDNDSYGETVSMLQDVADANSDAFHRAYELEKENESLKKDAARYRWTTIEGNWVARMFGKWRAHIGEYGDSNPTDWFDTREEAIDAAMSNKE